MTIGDDAWLTARRRVVGPGLEVAVAAPLSSYVAPFTRAARIGTTAVALVTSFALLLTTFLATRMPRPLEQLADAAAAVADGHLDHRVESMGPSELRRLGNSFNVMTNSLRRTLDELSHRSSLAAVGEFAPSLSHEVRNALASIKVDL